MSELDIYLTQAEAAVKINNPYAAWEILLKAEDVDLAVALNRNKASLAAQVARLWPGKKAAQHEATGQYPPASVLSRTRKSASEPIGNDGIQRVSAALLDKLSNGL